MTASLPTTGLRRWAALLLATCLTTVGLAAVPMSAAATTADTIGGEPQLQITATFDQLTFDDQLAAVVSSGATTADASWATATFSVECSAASGCPTEATTTWRFSDGTTATGPTARHVFDTPGIHRVTATVNTAVTRHTATLKVLAAPRYADADVSTAAGSSVRDDRSALWIAGALDVLEPCTYPTGDNTRFVVLRICPTVPNNFADTAELTLPNGSTYNPAGRDACTDGTTATFHQGNWQLTDGSEPGCLTRQDLYRAAVVLLDGTTPTDDPTTARPLANLNNCAGVPTSALRRAAALGVDAMPTTDDGRQQCNPNQTVTKRELYDVMAAVSGTNQGCTNTFADLTGNDDEPVCGTDTIGLLAAGTTVVGDTTCPQNSTDDAAVCFNGHQPMVRADLAQLVSQLLLRNGRPGSPLQATASTNTDNTFVNSTAQITIAVTSATNVADSVTVEWPTSSHSRRQCAATTDVVLQPTQTTTSPPAAEQPADGSGNNAADDSQTTTAAEQQPSMSGLTAEATCGYHIQKAGPATLYAQVTDSLGRQTVVPLRLVGVDRNPTITVDAPASTNEDMPVNITVSTQDPDGQQPTITFADINAQTSDSPWTADTTQVSGGTVTRIEATNTGARLQVVPQADSSQLVQFTVRACTSTTACSTKDVHIGVQPTNDPPVGPATLQVLFNPDTPDLDTIGVVVDPPANDSADGSNTTVSYKLVMPPTVGQLHVDVNGQLSPLPTGTVVPAGTTVRWQATETDLEGLAPQQVAATFRMVPVDDGHPSPGRVGPPTTVVMIATN